MMQPNAQLMNAKRTPGPWRTRSTGRDCVIEAADPAGVSAAPFQVAVVTCGDFTDATRRAKQVNEANAQLIAAAPDLLAAIKAYVAEAESHTDQGRPGSPFYERLQAARAAIAKAEGQS